MNCSSKSALFLTIVILTVLLIAPVSAQEQTTITYWDWAVTAGPAIDEAIAAFEEANPNINVEKVTQQADNYNNLINLAFQSESAPDVFVVPQSITLRTQVENGWLEPLNNFADFEEFRGTFPDPESRFVEGVNVFNGNAYSAPLFLSGPWLQVYINTVLYEEAGLVNEDGTLQAPTTWEELVENSRVIKQETGRYGLGFGGTTNQIEWFWWGCQLSAPFWVDIAPGLDYRTGEFAFASTECYRDMIDALLDIRDEELMLPESLSLDDESVRVRFANGDFAHLFAGSWVIGGWETTNPDFASFTAVPVPLANETTEPSSSFYEAPGGYYLGINANSENKEAAWEFLKFVYGPTYGEIIARDGHGVTYFAPGELADYAETPAQIAILEMSDLVVPAPLPSIRNPDVSRVQLTVVGPQPADVLMGIYTGQITDIDAALADLDTRYDAALEQAIADAQAAGAQVTREDFAFPDWVPNEPYVMDLN